ncbi:MAG: preprotein translocase subunit SecG [Chitinophagaceae bacterium]
MTILFLVLIIVAAGILGFIILVQNPKGGGLQGNVGGFGNQFMGVKQTTDVLEKGTWIFAGFIGILCLVSTLFFSTGSSKSSLDRNFNAPAQKAAPVTPPVTTPVTPPVKAPVTPAPANNTPVK